MQTQTTGKALCERNLHTTVGRHLGQASLYNCDMLSCLSKVIAIQKERSWRRPALHNHSERRRLYNKAGCALEVGAKVALFQHAVQLLRNLIDLRGSWVKAVHLYRDV